MNKQMKEVARAIRKRHGELNGDKAMKCFEHAETLKITDEADQYAEAAIAVYEACAWRPIEEAPKDSETVLLLHYREQEAISGWWCEELREWRCYEDELQIPEDYFTYYMPLPTPPSNEGE